MVPRLDVERGTLGFGGELDDDGEPMPKDVQQMLIRTIMIAFGALVAIEAVVLVILLCVLRPIKRKREQDQPIKAMIVLGSGGHTAEMLRLVGSLDKKKYSPRVYVTATTDAMSSAKAVEAEKSFAPDGKASGFEVYAIPRSREVGQSYVTSIFTTIRALVHAAMVVYTTAPEMIIVNGPGTCIPICAVAYFFNRLTLQPCELVYIESIARVRKLSLSGKILYHTRMADVFLVQWEELVKRYPRAIFADRVY